jgi:hypothetical protein
MRRQRLCRSVVKKTHWDLTTVHRQFFHSATPSRHRDAHHHFGDAPRHHDAFVKSDALRHRAALRRMKNASPLATVHRHVMTVHRH